MTNLIQNTTNNLNAGISTAQNTTKKYYSNFIDINSDNLLKPLDGKGYLVHNNLLNAPKHSVQDSYYTAKSLQKGLAGKANDHELGKLNDLGLKIGGLSIAGYLMTKRSTPKAKAMEFIGFGAFLASMAIWPKVALQLPAKLIHGFNIRQQYVDEQGRKKFTTQDPNYVPFDLYKGETKDTDLSKIGDKMGIKKDLNNRNDVVKDQMTKISRQNNTMWMMTAGIATPVMTALSCNLAEKHVGKFFENKTNNKMNILADEIHSYMSGNNSLETKVVTPHIDKESAEMLEAMLSSKVGKPVNQQDITKISEALTVGLDTKTQKAAQLDLQFMLSGESTVVDKNTAKNINKLLTSKIDTRYGEGTAAKIINPEKLTQHVDDFMNASGNPAGGVLAPEKADEFRSSLLKFIEDSTASNESLKASRKEMIETMGYEAVDGVLAKSKASVLTEEAAGHISKAGASLRKFRAVDQTISNVSHFKVEKAQETLAGNHWGEVTEVFMKELNISPKELNEAKSSEELSAQLLTRKLEEIAKNETRYKKMVKNISSKMAELDLKLDNPTQGKKPVMDIIVDGIRQNCDKTASELNNVSEHGKRPFSNLAQRIAGETINGVAVGSIKEAKVRRIQNARVGSIQNSYMRLLHTMDFFKRAEDYKAGKGGFSGDAKLDKELISKGKKILTSSHSGDFYLKFQTANNVNFYKALMWHTFGVGEQGMAQATKDSLNTASHEVFTGGRKTTMAQRVGRWATHIKDLMGTNKFDFQPYHTEGNEIANNAEKTAVAKFNKIACTPADMLYNASKQKFNSNKWMKIFSTIGGIVLAGTVASQFAFGGKDDSIKEVK